MSSIPSFIFGGNAPARTPQEAARNRAVYEALASRMSAPKDLGEGLTSVGNAWVARTLMDRAAAGEEAGSKRVAELVAGFGDGADQGELLTALSDPWFADNAGGSAVAQTLLQRELKKDDPSWKTFESNGDIYRFNENDPNATPGLFFDAPDAAPEFRPMTADERAAWGIPENDPTPYAIGADGLPKPISGKGQTINVGGNNDIGTIPPGKMVQRDENGNVIGMVDIPGGPSAAEAAVAAEKTDLAAGRKDIAADTVTTAASIARDLANKPGNTGIPGAVMSNISETEAAELRRQVGVLTATATIENLTAMRQASPTGGALGSVTEKEGAMLAAAAGAIDPNAKAEDFNRALDNYELTLLKIVHGPAEGEKLFAETRKTATPDGNIPMVTDDATFDALPSGATFKAPDGTIRKKP